ncbi:protein of unknown function [Candidatus Bipolaricaulis anaerobius]|uniref:Uncharacterized protein n=1 Tax=Candidatus Bipolaricaulis anaerobius TaxID=2026885 RepID=A0A2X3MKS3_9BACT|nr:protein of unknown function [Candidatus Bipolaricaulis anaerobius]
MSGRSHLPGEQVHPQRVPWVQIPPPPPEGQPGNYKPAINDGTIEERHRVRPVPDTTPTPATVATC